MSSTSFPNPRTATHPFCRDDSSPWTISRASAARTPTVPSMGDGTPETSRSANATASRTTSVCSTATRARPAPPSARAHPCSIVGSPKTRRTPCSTIWPRATASDRPSGSSVSIATPSSDWPVRPEVTPTTPMTRSWLSPPRTREVQLDEKWSFVAERQKNCDPTEAADDHKGDWWYHVAYDPEHKLVLAVVPGACVTESVAEVVTEAKDRLDEQPSALSTRDEYPVSATVIAEVFSQPVAAPQEPAGPG